MKLRHECKHNINNQDVFLLKRRLSSVLKHDSFSKDDGTYLIKSLYFDNFNDKALREKLDGTDKREKFRIRYYNNDTSFIMLEKKSKINGLCAKEKAKISVEECQKLLNNDIHFLIESSNPLFNELYFKMKSQLLRPKTIVAYEREAFVFGAGNVRVTLDMNIRGSYNVQSFLTPDTSFVKLGGNSVLEVKWDEFLPDFIKDLTHIKGRRTSAFSKYAFVRY